MSKTAQTALEDIAHLCGTVNHSSFNQMKDAVTGAVEITEEALRELNQPPSQTPQQGTPEIRKGMKHGVYKIFWKEGGSSLASVGYTHDGSNWYAPCNWTSKENDYPQVAITDWSKVERVELIQENNYNYDNTPSQTPQQAAQDYAIANCEPTEREDYASLCICEPLKSAFLSGVEWQKAQEVEGAEFTDILTRIVEGTADYLSVNDDCYDGRLSPIIEAAKEWHNKLCQSATPHPVSPWVSVAKPPTERERYYYTKGRDWFAYIHGNGDWTIEGKQAEITHYLDESLLPNPNPQP